jgi:hypothetical protein
MDWMDDLSSWFASGFQRGDSTRMRMHDENPMR